MTDGLVPHNPLPEEREELYRQAQMQWGHEAQMQKAAEEFAEVAAVLNRALLGQADGDEVLDELADARIMLEQMETLHTDEAVEERLAEKTCDLEARLAGGSSD